MLLTKDALTYKTVIITLTETYMEDEEYLKYTHQGFGFLIK